MVFLLIYLIPVGIVVGARQLAQSPDSWWDMRRDSSQQAPDPSTRDAIVQVYAARAARWRGSFGVHTWIATKRSDENYYTRIEVIGYGTSYGRNAVRIRGGVPDGYWFNNKPDLLREVRGGASVDAMIDSIYAAADNYPYSHTYKVWPGPNSNTFMAYLGRAVPELKLELPSNAIGKDYLPTPSVLAATPSGQGVQLNFSGYGGLLLGWEAGVELNILGLTAGIDFNRPAIKLPAVGRLGFSDFKQIPM